MRSGVNTGDCAVIPRSLANSFAAYDLILTFQSDVTATYVANFLDTEVGRLQLNLVKGRSAQPHINADEVAALQVPSPPMNEQIRLIAQMDAVRSERKAKLSEADALLAGIGDFVLDALGVTPPPRDSRRVFAVCSSQILKGGSLNSDYYHPERMLALRSLDNESDKLIVATLDEVVSFERNQVKTPGKNYLGLAHVQSDTGELTDSTDTAKGTCFIYTAGDVLFARLRPYLNKVYHAEMDGCCSTEFHVLRVKEGNPLLPDYLAAMLRTRIVLAQTVHMMTGNTHPRLTNDDVANLRIPIPSIGVQESITAEVRRRREQSRRLRSEAESGWQDAKHWFEKQLLGT